MLHFSSITLHPCASVVFLPDQAFQLWTHLNSSECILAAGLLSAAQNAFSAITLFPTVLVGSTVVVAGAIILTRKDAFAWASWVRLL